MICLTLKGSLVGVLFAGSDAAADHPASSPEWIAANRAWAMHVGREKRDNPHQGLNDSPHVDSARQTSHLTM